MQNCLFTLFQEIMICSNAWLKLFKALFFATEQVVRQLRLAPSTSSAVQQIVAQALLWAPDPHLIKAVQALISFRSLIQKIDIENVLFWLTLMVRFLWCSGTYGLRIPRLRCPAQIRCPSTSCTCILSCLLRPRLPIHLPILNPSPYGSPM